MAERPIRVLHVNVTDLRGGTAKHTLNVHHALRRRGHSSWIVVGRRRTDEPYVLELDNDRYRSGLARLWLGAHNLLWPALGKFAGRPRIRELSRMIGEPARLIGVLRGREDLDFPATWRLLSLLPQRPDLIHCHLLNGRYFDLGALPWLSSQVPVAVTLHAAWLLSGHCAYSLDCDRWKTGCGRCPDLKIWPAVLQDSTAYNWKRKRDIYARSRLYVSAPSAWMIKRAEQSILAQGMVEARVIPNGVDLSVFHPAGKLEARAELGIDPDSTVLLFVAANASWNIWKDYRTIRDAVAILSRRLRRHRIIFTVLGDKGPDERAGSAAVKFVPFQQDAGTVARYYQAADVHLHAARADNFPNVVLEALACGRPVVATAVGGIPEQVKGLSGAGLGAGHPTYGEQEATGVLVPPGDPGQFAAAVEKLLVDERLCAQLGANAVEDARKRFDLSTVVQAYLDWYGAIVEAERQRSPLKRQSVPS